MEAQAARQTLMQALPPALKTVETLSKLGIGAGGIAYLIKTLAGQ